MKILRVSLLSLFAIFVALNSAVAADLQVEVRFSQDEISLIAEFYKGDKSSKGRGKKEKNTLPPGIEKNLRRGKRLPPGIAKKSLPGDLLVRLPPAPAGYDRIVVAGKVLLVEVATQVIHDILTDVVFD